MPDPQTDKAAPVIAWLLGEGRRTDHRMRDFTAALSARIVAAGIPIARAFAGVRTLHPQVAAVAYVWRDDGGEVQRMATGWTDANSVAFLNNPAYQVGTTGERIRQRLDVPDEMLRYAIYRQFKEEGMTDYYALPMQFSDGAFNPLTFQTRAPGGFSEADIAAIERIAEVTSLIVEIEWRHRVARTVLDTYVGPRSGRRVLAGAIRRGQGEDIDAVVWFCDLRGFSALTETLSREALIAHLNEYFGLMGAAIEAEDGEVLKFIGDAMLAIFPFGDGVEPRERCAAALRAAAAARAALAARNAEGRADGRPEIQSGIALHLGEVTYGNIGAATRLDFTVIGPAVNLAARLQELGADLGETVLVSAAFAEMAGAPMRTLGCHTLRGLAGPHKVFAPAG